MERRLDKVCDFYYKDETSKRQLSRIIISYYHLDETVKSREKIEVLADKNGRIRKRAFTKGGVKITEEWLYNREGLLCQINYFNDDTKKPFAVSYKKYLSDSDWDGFLEKYAVYPQTTQAKK